MVDNKQEYSENTIKLLETAYELSNECLPPTHPIRLTVANDLAAAYAQVTSLYSS